MPRTQKEMSYLQDAAKQEQLCIDLYQRYGQSAQDPQLAQLLQTIANQETQHLQTIQQLQQGQSNTGTGGQASAGAGGQQSGGGATGGQQGGSALGQGTQRMMHSGQAQSGGNQMTAQSAGQSTDRQACEELLSLEKSVSDLYDHAVFEFTDHQARQALDHIQQEEHHHGFMLWQYMNQQGWYQAE